jgi:hypothetical protein
MKGSLPVSVITFTLSNSNKIILFTPYSNIYLGYFKPSLVSIHSLPLWLLDDPSSSSPRWYNKLRSRLSGNLKRRVIENREKLQPNKSSCCGRQLLKEISTAILKTNKVDSIESRTESVCAWRRLSCGRCSLLSSIPHISSEPQRQRLLHSTERLGILTKMFSMLTGAWRKLQDKRCFYSFQMLRIAKLTINGLREDVLHSPTEQ